MRITLATLATAALFTGFGLGQTDKTFYFTQPIAPADVMAMVTTIRAIVDLQDVSADKVHQAVVMHGPVDRLVASEWLLHRLDRPAGETGPGTTGEYKISGEVIKLLTVSPTATVADLTSLATVIRTVGDLQRLLPLTGQNVIVVRGTPEKVAAAEWMVGQLLPHDGQAPTVDSPAFPSPIIDPRGEGEQAVIRILRLDPKTGSAGLTAAVTAIRVTADLQRLFPLDRGKAVIASGPPDKVAVAAWLVHELAKPAEAGAIHQTTMPGLMDGVVRLFYVGKASGEPDLTALVGEIRSTLGIQRIFPFSHPPAIVLRGRPDQMPTVEALVARFGAEAR